MSNNYYWRAVRRIAKRKGISITKARRLDWEKEANAERKRRSKAARAVRPVHKPSRKRTPKAPPVSHVRVKPPRKRIPTPRRVPKTHAPKRMPPKGPKPKLKIRDYGRMKAQDEEEYEETLDREEQWEADWESDYPDLDHMDELIDFLDDFEYEDSDKYKEPS